MIDITIFKYGSGGKNATCQKAPRGTPTPCPTWDAETEPMPSMIKKASWKEIKNAVIAEVQRLSV